MQMRAGSAGARALRWRFAKVVLAAGVVVALAGGPGGGAEAGTVGPRVLRAVLYGVSCKGRSFCLAVGNYSVPGDHDVRLAEEWNGQTWRDVPDPLSGNLGNLTCGSPSFCLASRPAARPLAEWNGRTWQMLKDQPPDMLDVSCGSPTVCLGAYGPAGQDFYGWNGTQWQDVSNCYGGSPGASCDWVTYPTCGSATMCIAVDSSCGDPECSVTYYDALTWPVSAPGGASTPFDDPDGQACAGQSFCMFTIRTAAAFTTDGAATWHNAPFDPAAVCPRVPKCFLGGILSCGYQGICMSLPLGSTVTLAWNGTTWTAEPLARIGGQIPRLASLSCGSASNCMAVGYYDPTATSRGRTIAEHWNGSAWQLTRTPDS
jgi:hypothetical protein